MSPGPAAVVRPQVPGAPQPALVNVNGAWAYLRAGPGDQYRVIGDVEDKSVLRYFPRSRTENDWVWVEQSWRAGWLAAFVVDFEPIEDWPGQPDQLPTPYDGRVAVWHWKGTVLQENNIDELAQRLNRIAPQVTEILVKICDSTEQTGADWQGRWDSKAELALTGPESIDRWVSALGRYGMNFHAWCVARGLDSEAETDLIIQACQRPGVRSLILDVEPYAGFWSGGREGIRPYMLRIRRQIPGNFHIGISVDPRRHHFRHIWPQEWRPFVDSVHPQVYWVTFGVLPEVALREAWDVWKDYGLPIVPVLQGDADPAEIRVARTLAKRRFRAPAIALWRLGVIGEAQFREVNQPDNTTDDTPANPPGRNGAVVLVRPDDAGFSRGSYLGGEFFGKFAGPLGWPVWYRPTQSSQSLTWAHWTPTLDRSITCEVAVFVPEDHASTQRASYQLQGVRGASSAVTVDVDQSRYNNQWVTLGVFALDATESDAGSVFLTDHTGESDRELAFDAVRWREMPGSSLNPAAGNNADSLADGYDAPTGTVGERRGTRLWPGDWRARDSFGQLAQRPGCDEGYLPGVNLSQGETAIQGAVFSCASGVATFAGTLPGKGPTLIIRHDPLRGSGRVLSSRYTHIEGIQVQIGDRVRRGEQIASTAVATGGQDFRLHFDLCATSALERNPGHWPGRNFMSLIRNYIDPLDFIAGHRPVESGLSG
ncbi:MAG: peptidoglycan DD-metalloendopeptidase family protein [Anaerolineaceae bacterium]|nr:peptidoglycan DD-metalloendopeptidase family protein [Anaerolineaceae bacterium]